MSRTLLRLLLVGSVLVAACSDSTTAPGRPQGTGSMLNGKVELVVGATLEVAGRTVHTSPNTRIHSQALSELHLGYLRVGDPISLSGIPLSDGSILADDIEVESDEVEIHGAIEAIAAPNLTVAGRTVATDANTEFRKGDAILALADFQVGQVVEVEGTLQSDGALLAREVRIRGEEEHGTVVSGTVASVEAPDFTVGGVIIHTDASTRIEKGDTPLTLADLMVGDTVDVRAMQQSDGSLLALCVRVRFPEAAEGDVEIKGTISDIMAPDLTVDGKTVLTDANTRIVMDGTALTLADLNVGEAVEVEGSVQPDGSILAHEIKVEAAEQEEVDVRGTITMVSGPSLTIGTSAVVTNAHTLITRDGDVLAFTALNVGDNVEVRGVLQADHSILAERIEVEQ